MSDCTWQICGFSSTLGYSQAHWTLSRVSMIHQIGPLQQWVSIVTHQRHDARRNVMVRLGCGQRWTTIDVQKEGSIKTKFLAWILFVEYCCLFTGLLATTKPQKVLFAWNHSLVSTVTLQSQRLYLTTTRNNGEIEMLVNRAWKKMKMLINMVWNDANELIRNEDANGYGMKWRC